MSGDLVKGADRPLPEHFRSILVLQLGYVGDMILSLPVVRTLRDRYPDSRIVLCVRAFGADLLRACFPWADDVIPVEKKRRSPWGHVAHQVRFFRGLRRNRFDLAVVLRTGTRGAVLSFLSGAPFRIGHLALARRPWWRNALLTHLVYPLSERTAHKIEYLLNILSPLDLPVRDRVPRLVVPPDLAERAGALLRSVSVTPGRPLVAFHPYSNRKNKEWPPERFAALMDHVNDRHACSVLLTGGPGDRPAAEALVGRCLTRVHNLAGRTSLAELPGIFQACRLLVGVDTGPLHIAAAVGTPTLSLYGPTDPAAWSPAGDGHVVVSSRSEGPPPAMDQLPLERVREHLDAALERLGATAAADTSSGTRPGP